MAAYGKDKQVREEFPIQEFVVPQVGTSPITGIQGTLNWGGLNRPDQRSRWVIGDADLDDLINVLPQGVQLQQVPYKGVNLCTLAASVIWLHATYLNLNPLLMALCSNGHIYQITVGGAVTDINPAGGFATTCDMTNWQGTVLIFSDPVAQKIYSWDGTTFATVFSSQPATHVEVFQNRLWMANGLSLTWTNVNTYNSLTGDAGSIVISDNDAQSGIAQMLSLEGNLYLFGANWIKTISQLTDTGSPAVLIFNLTTITNQVGIATRWSVEPVGNIIYFANTYGIWAMQGSAPVKISPQLDGFFQNLNESLSTFSAAYGTIYETPCLFWHVYYNGDQNVPAGHTVVGVTFPAGQPGQWFRVQQGAITYITGTAAAQVTNNLPLVFGTDGTNVFQLFNDTSTSYTCYLNTKIWDITGSKLDYKIFDFVTVVAIITGNVTVTVGLVTEYGTVLTTTSFAAASNIGQWANAAAVKGNWINTGAVQGSWQGANIAGYFPFQFNVAFTRRGLGLNITLTGTQAVVQSLIVGYRRTRAGRGP